MILQEIWEVQQFVMQAILSSPFLVLLFGKACPILLFIESILLNPYCRFCFVLWLIYPLTLLPTQPHLFPFSFLEGSFIGLIISPLTFLHSFSPLDYHILSCTVTSSRKGPCMIGFKMLWFWVVCDKHAIHFCDSLIDLSSESIDRAFLWHVFVFNKALANSCRTVIRIGHFALFSFSCFTCFAG